MIAASLFRRGSERHAERPALSVEDRWWSHAELAETADRIAGGLTELGVRPGDRVLLALPNSPELLMIELALLRNGLVRVALGARARAAEVAAIARDCEARAIVLENPPASPPEGTPEPESEPEPDSRAAFSGRVLVTRQPHPDADATIAGLARADPVVGVSTPGPDDPAMLMYSSGSTGDPKAAVVTQRGWASCMVGLAERLPSPSGSDLLVQSAPMSHFGGSLGLTYAAYGAATVVLPRFDPPRVLDAVRTYGGTVLPMAPTMLRRLSAALHQLEPEDRPTGTLRAVPYGGSAISASDLGRAVDVFGGALVQFYGLAEALTPVTVLDGPSHLAARKRQLERATPAAAQPESGFGQGPEPGHGGPPDAVDVLDSAGSPASDTEVRITDPHGKPLADGEVGEIRVRGPRVMPTYWRRPEATARVLVDGWFATGDLGYLDGGLLYLVDRSKDVIVSGGYNVYPSEVERVIRELAEVREVAVVAVPDERWGEGVGAVVVPADGASLTAEDVVLACRKRLASHKKPVHVEFVAALPTNGAGKIDKKALRDRFWRSYTRRVGG